MRILHINSYCSDSKFYKNLFVKQEEHQINNTAYIPVSLSKDTDSMDFGENAVVSKVFSKFDRLTYISKHKKILEDVEKKVDVKNYDIIHAHSLFSNGYIAYMLYKKYNIPYITAVRDTDVNFFFKYFFFMRKLGIEILHNAQKIIFISPKYRENALVPYVKDYYNSDIYKKTIVVPNGVDDFWIKNKNTNCCESDDKEIKVLCVARISKRKNIPLLIKACEKLKEDGHNIKISIVGKVEDEREFSKIQKSSIAKYYPPCNKEKLIDYYRENNVFALLSHTETFGLVYLEAMSQGLPVIYTRGQGFDGQLPEGTVGYSSSDKIASEISGKILMAYKNRKELSKNGLKDIQKFNWDDLAQKYGEIYSEILR